MKDKLYAFYHLPDAELDRIWKNGLLVVDTNVLLDLYRLEPGSRDDLKKSIDSFKERIWIPYQTALEFQRNRKNVIQDLGEKKYDEFKDKLDSYFSKAKECFKEFKRHPCIDYSYIERALNKVQADLNKKSEGWKKAYPFHEDKDQILDWVTKKYEGKVGDDLEMEALLAIFKEGEIRYKAQIPPGYKDMTQEKKEAGNRYLYGDLIIWKSIIKKAKSDKVDVIFLTNDNKEDWFERSKGKTIGPRFELIREFHNETEQDIIILTEASFLKEIKEKAEVEVKASSIKDAEGALDTIPLHKYLDWNNRIVLYSFDLDSPYARFLNHANKAGGAGYFDLPPIELDNQDYPYSRLNEWYKNAFWGGEKQEKKESQEQEEKEEGEDEKAIKGSPIS